MGNVIGDELIPLRLALMSPDGRHPVLQSCYKNTFGDYPVAEISAIRTGPVFVTWSEREGKDGFRDELNRQAEVALRGLGRRSSRYPDLTINAYVLGELLDKDPRRMCVCFCELQEETLKVMLNARERGIEG